MEIESYARDGGSDGSIPEMSLEEGKNEEAMYLVWNDLSVILPNSGNGHARKLLEGLSGHAEPGRIMAIMGPSGSGKSTLLDSLAGSFSLSHIVLFPHLACRARQNHDHYGAICFSFPFPLFFC